MPKLAEVTNPPLPPTPEGPTTFGERYAPGWYGKPLPPMTPGTKEWYKSYSASKISAILGLSVYESPYSLWAKMTGRLESDSTPSPAAERGTYLEPALLQWFKDKHPELVVTEGASFAHPLEKLFNAAPDGMVSKPDTPTDFFGIIEIKTAARSEEWGSEGTADIPPGYLVQVAWQMFITGADHCFVVGLVSMNLGLWEVTRADVEPFLADIVQRVVEFKQLVDEGTPPAWDGHDKTYEAVREMHPEIDDEEAVCSQEFADWVARVRAAEDDAKKEFSRAKSEIAAFMGRAKVLKTENNDVVARRQARGGSSPWVVVPKPK